MFNTVQLIEMIGRDSKLQEMNKVDLADFISSNVGDVLVSKALIENDIEALNGLIFASSRGCYLLIPTEDEQETEDSPEKQDDKVSLQ